MAFLIHLGISGNLRLQHNVLNVNLFDKLEQDIHYFPEKGIGLLGGDINSRISNKPEYVELDKLLPVEDESLYSVDQALGRESMDSVCNSFGINFLELLCSTGMRVLNGRLFDVKNTGKFTCVNKQGSSVVDYVCALESNFNLIKDFEVHDLTQHSDHTPLSFTLSQFVGSAQQKDEYDHESFYTKWDSNYRENFRENIKTNIDQINSACSQLQYNVDECTINNVVNSLSDILNDSAKPYFVHKCNVNAKSGYFNSITKENQWFNEDCKNSRKAYLTALNQFNCNPSNENRILLMHRKAKYKKLVVKTKRIYFNNKCIEIKALQRQSPKLFWNHFKSKRKVAGESISPQNFFEYFRNISTNCNDNFSNPSVSQYVQENNCENPAVYSELDKEFTQEELLASIKNLKGGKASGCDNLLYEYVIETFDILGNVWVKLFNAIFSSGHFPEKWTEGVIIPLHKKRK